MRELVLRPLREASGVRVGRGMADAAAVDTSRRPAGAVAGGAPAAGVEGTSIMPGTRGVLGSCNPPRAVRARADADPNGKGASSSGAERRYTDVCRD